jgi:hypothetical protein
LEVDNKTGRRFLVVFPALVKRERALKLHARHCFKDANFSCVTSTMTPTLRAIYQLSAKNPTF